VVNTAYGELQARNFAQGGNVNGYYLGGPTIPADVVSHLGNGNSDAGAQNLYSMMDRIRQDRTGTTKQGKQIDPNKYLA
jgi:hypothetical protein